MYKILSTILAILLTVISAQAQRSEGTATAQLNNRTLTGKPPRLTVSGQVEGKVVVSLWVDPYGSVQRVVPGADGTTVDNKNVWKVVESAALRAHFNASAEAPSLQEGTITYTFVSSGLVETDESVLKFMDVPIDGLKSQMIVELEDKGFRGDLSGKMTGMFNGEKVSLSISTNHGLVDGVMVEYPRCERSNDTRVKYNVLLSRFNRNAKYVSVSPRAEIPAGEDILNNIGRNSKYYDAVYFFLRPEISVKQWTEDFKQEYQKHYNKPQQGLSYEEMEEALFCLPMKTTSAVSGVVWFTMSDPYSIIINYVNLNNRPRGEDL